MNRGYVQPLKKVSGKLLPDHLDMLYRLISAVKISAELA